MPKGHQPLSDASSDDQPDQRPKKSGKKTAKIQTFFGGLPRMVGRKKGPEEKYGSVEFDQQGLFPEAKDDASDAEEYLTARRSRDAFSKTTNHPAINFSFFHLQDDGVQEELSLQEDEELLKHEGLDEEEAANPEFSSRVPLTRTSLNTHNHAVSHHPFTSRLMKDLPERLENEEKHEKSPRGDHSGSTHCWPDSFRPTHGFGIIDIESLKDSFKEVPELKDYLIIDPLPKYIKPVSGNPLVRKKSDPIIAHVVRQGPDSEETPLIHLRNNSIELPQNFEKHKKTYKQFQQEATALLLQQLSIGVIAKNPNVILVAEINQEMINCDNGNLLKKILTNVNGKHPPIKVIFNLPPSAKVNKKTKELIDRHNDRIKSLLYPHKPPLKSLGRSRNRMLSLIHI